MIYRIYRIYRIPAQPAVSRELPGSQPSQELPGSYPGTNPARSLPETIRKPTQPGVSRVLPRSLPGTNPARSLHNLHDPRITLLLLLLQLPPAPLLSTDANAAARLRTTHGGYGNAHIGSLNIQYK